MSAIRSRRSSPRTSRPPGRRWICIEVKFEVLKTIADPAGSPAKPEPRIHGYGEQGNIHRIQSYDFGDIAGALAKSDHVSSTTLSSTKAIPTCRSSNMLRSRRRTAEGKLTLWSSTQIPHYLHRALARALGVRGAHPRHRLPNGGGFGGKCDLHNHEIVVARRRSSSAVR